MGSFVNSIFSVLLSWVSGLASGLWQLFTGDPANGVGWFGRNWKWLVIFLCVICTAVDIVIHLLRWQPHKVWGSFFRRIRGQQSGDTAPASEAIHVPTRPGPAPIRTSQGAKKASAVRAENRPAQPVRQQTAAPRQAHNPAAPAAASVSAEPATRRQPTIQPTRNDPDQQQTRAIPARNVSTGKSVSASDTHYTCPAQNAPTVVPASSGMPDDYKARFARPAEHAAEPLPVRAASRRARNYRAASAAVPNEQPVRRESQAAPAYGRQSIQSSSATQTAAASSRTAAGSRSTDAAPQQERKPGMMRRVKEIILDDGGTDTLDFHFRPAELTVDEAQAYKKPVYPAGWKQPEQNHQTGADR